MGTKYNNKSSVLLLELLLETSIDKAALRMEQ